MIRHAIMPGEIAPPPALLAGSGRLLANMQVLRFIGAMMVLISHLVREMRTTHLGPGIVAGIERLGVPWPCGVDLFFMISGFLMLYLTWDHFAEPGYRTEFLKRRVIRVVPLYWLSTLAFIAVAAVRPGVIAHNDIGVEHVLTSMLFIPSLRGSGGIYPILVLGWTLNYEMLFYVAYAVMIGLTRRAALIALPVLFLAAGVYHLAANPATPIVAFWSDPIILEFVAGGAICWLYMQGVRLGLAMRLGCVVLGLALLIAATHLGIADTEVETSAVPRAFWAGLPCALIVAGFMLGAQMDMRSTIVAFLVAGGDASYSLYLTHMFPTRALTIGFHALRIDSGWLFFAAGMVLAPLVAFAAYRLVERPVLAVLRRRFEPRRQWVSA